MILKSFAETPLNQPVKYKVRNIANKMELLDREIKYLLNKVKIWKPKQETETNQTYSKSTTEENEKAPTAEFDEDKKIEKNKHTKEDISDNVEQQQEEPTSKATDATEDPMVLVENKEPHLSDDQDFKEIHQEL